MSSELPSPKEYSRDSILPVSQSRPKQAPSIPHRALENTILRYLGFLMWWFKASKKQESGKKKEPKPKLFGPDIFWWGGGLPREGVVAKRFDMSFETRESQILCRDIPGFWLGYPGGARKVSEKVKSVFNYVP